jgi:hypothetical protein
MQLFITLMRKVVLHAGSDSLLNSNFKQCLCKLKMIVR